MKGKRDKKPEKEKVSNGKGDEWSKPNLIRLKTERVQFYFQFCVNIFLKSVTTRRM